jgi:hypothetical protein
MVDRYAKFATENFSLAASRIERGRESNVVHLLHVFPTVGQKSA